MDARTALTRNITSYLRDTGRAAQAGDQGAKALRALLLELNRMKNANAAIISDFLANTGGGHAGRDETLGLRRLQTQRAVRWERQVPPSSVADADVTSDGAISGRRRPAERANI